MIMPFSGVEPQTECWFVWDEVSNDFVRVRSPQEIPDDHRYVNNTVGFTLIEKGGVIFDVSLIQVFGDVLSRLTYLAEEAHRIYGRYGENLQGVEIAIDDIFGKPIE